MIDFPSVQYKMKIKKITLSEQFQIVISKIPMNRGKMDTSNTYKELLTLWLGKCYKKWRD